MKRVQKRALRQLKEQGIDYEVIPDNVQRLPCKTNLKLRKIHPLTENQRKTFQYYESSDNLLLHGLAGTGKTFISVYLALHSILEKFEYKKLYIVRSIVPTRDIGFLPGNQKDKSKAYELPYYAICSELFGRGDSYDLLKNKGIIEFLSTSFIRGTTLSDCIVIVDECQNLTFHELDSVITRLGQNASVIFCGDFRQSDLKKSEKSGIMQFIDILQKIKSFSHVEFQEDDIVRSGIVKEYIITKDRLGYTETF